MDSPNRTLPNTQRRVTARVLMAWLVCVLLLPLPVPMMHRHDSIAVPQALASHLAQRHSDSQLQCLAGDDAHWHLVLPSHCCDEEGNDDGLPKPPTEYVGSDLATVPSVSSVAESLAGVSCLSLIVWSDTSIEQDRSTNDPRQRWALGALQRHRCALSCVMRC